MREQVTACLESIIFDCDEVHGTPGGVSWLISSQVVFLHMSCCFSLWVCHCSLHLPGPEQDFFPCSHKHFDYLSSLASSGKIMSFHELLQMDCDFDLMICNNGVQDFAMSATGLEQESFPAHAHRSISNVKCFNHSSCKLSKLDSATWAES